MFNYTYEVEVTNFCNAKCVFCHNPFLSRKKGYIDVDKLSNFVSEQKNRIKDNVFFKNGIKGFPRFTLCGLGDPLLHPSIIEIVRIIKNNGFTVQLVTNGYILNNNLLSGLIDAGVDEIDISLHSVNDQNYYAITGLNLNVVLNNLLLCSEQLKSEKIKVMFWRIKHPKKEYIDNDIDNNNYMDFIYKMGFDESSVLGPSAPWYRDGVVKNSECDFVNDDPFWCNKIIFTFNIDWEGNVVLCCNDYNREIVELGNVFNGDFDYENYYKIKKDIIFRKKTISLCNNCRRWADLEIYKICDKDFIKKEIVDCIYMTND